MFKHAQFWPNVFFGLVLLAVSVFFIHIIRGFLMDVFLAIILSQLFYGLYGFLVNQLGWYRRLSAILVVTLTIGVIVVPVFLIGLVFATEAADVVVTMQRKWPAFQDHLAFFEWFQSLPILAPIQADLTELNMVDKIGNMVAQSTGFVLNLTQWLFVNLNLLVFHSITTTIFMYYILVDGKRLMVRLHYLVPLKNNDERQIINEIKKIINATLLGTLCIGLIEGFFGFVILSLFGIPSAFFWSVMLLVVSVIPLIGTTFVYLPMGLVYISLGHIAFGGCIAILGFMASQLSQNIIKPKLVGSSSGLHPGLFLICTLGGLFTFGLPGFLIGPLVGTLFVVLWNQYGAKFNTLLRKWNAGPSAL